jgi:hypothetical protein
MTFAVFLADKRDVPLGNWNGHSLYLPWPCSWRTFSRRVVRSALCGHVCIEAAITINDRAALLEDERTFDAIALL